MRDTARKPTLKTIASSKWAARFFPVLKIAGDAALRAPVALNKSVCVIGRQLGVHLPLSSTKVSKVHALIVRQRGSVYIRDLASRNHLYVNDQPVRETDLSNGDAVRVGPYTLHCASGFSTAPEEAEQPVAITPAAPEATLQVMGDSTRVPLDARAILIGQRDDCELTLADERVSPVHAVVFELDGKRFLRDLNSSAGAFVNNQTVHQHELEAGDEIRIGRSRIRYQVEGATPAASDPPPPPRRLPIERAIDLSELDDDAPIPVDAQEPEDPLDHPLSELAADEPEHADRISLDDEAPAALGVIGAAIHEDAAEPTAPHDGAPPSPDSVSIPLGEETTRKLDQIVSQLSEKVAELETTWKEARDDARPADDPAARPD